MWRLWLSLLFVLGRAAQAAEELSCYSMTAAQQVGGDDNDNDDPTSHETLQRGAPDAAATSGGAIMDMVCARYKYWGEIHAGCFPRVVGGNRQLTCSVLRELDPHACCCDTSGCN